MLVDSKPKNKVHKVTEFLTITSNTYSNRDNMVGGDVA